MKYMGSKRWMLRDGLGFLLEEKVSTAKRFVDLFTGSGAVATFVAQRVAVPVAAFDLQLFSVTLARAVVGRTALLESGPLWVAWHDRAMKFLEESSRLKLANAPFPRLSKFTQRFVREMRDACASEKGFTLTKAYGGHYFSLKQALWLDALRSSLPEGVEERTSSLAALIQGASRCAASPGHTAQPLQPTRSAKKYLYEAWAKDIVSITRTSFGLICKQYALCKGSAEVRDANMAVEELSEDDLVFIDPPYSGVHYSRFYHVLETIARGVCSDVSGVGRYPPPVERPWSRFSVPSESRKAVSSLIEKVAERGARAIVTFPDKRCTNGISSYLLRKLGKVHFKKMSEMVVRGKFSTLGGNGNHREARQPSAEMVLVLEP